MFAHTTQNESAFDAAYDSAARDDGGREVRDRHLRVLVADDDADFRATLVSALKRFGLKVSVVCDGNALLQALSAPAEEKAPDLVITDNHMPGCNGLAALQVMHRSGLRTPTIVITGFRDAATQATARALGAVAVLQKPFDLKELKATINAALV